MSQTKYTVESVLTRAGAFLDTLLSKARLNVKYVVVEGEARLAHALIFSPHSMRQPSAPMRVVCAEAQPKSERSEARAAKRAMVRCCMGAGTLPSPPHLRQAGPHQAASG